jgi:acetoin utilization deacetylase AcuC-like enzyme
MRTNKIKVFYNPKQVLALGSNRNFSKSPLKPKLLLEYMHEIGFGPYLEITKAFHPFGKPDFCIAHSQQYVKSFFAGTELSRTNGLNWSEQFADSVRYTNASLHAAIRNSLVNPSEVSFSPTSGFHHAKPHAGGGFCTFSGQVIASVKVWRELGKVGCYLDLDGHFGNSIEDARKYQPDINMAVPKGFNFNPIQYDKYYYKELMHYINTILEPAILAGNIDYVVWCHGADSHKDDDMSGRVSTEYWIKCATFFWSWVRYMDAKLGRPLPVSCALFGGYRSDHYESVLSLHTADLVECMKNLLDLAVTYEPTVSPKTEKQYDYYRERPTQPAKYMGRSTDLRSRRQELMDSDEAMLARLRAKYYN